MVHLKNTVITLRAMVAAIRLNSEAPGADPHFLCLFVLLEEAIDGDAGDRALAIDWTLHDWPFTGNQILVVDVVILRGLESILLDDVVCEIIVLSAMNRWLQLNLSIIII